MENQPIIGSQSSPKLTETPKDPSVVEQQQQQQPTRSSSFMAKIPKRHVLAMYAFFGFFFAYSMRANLSVAIVNMSNTQQEEQTVRDVNSNNQTSQKQDNKWSSISQGYLLSSFFYGYIVTQLPAGFLTNRFGGSYFFGAGIGMCAILSLLIPMATRFGLGYVICVRILQGIAQGFIFPSMHCMWSKWSPQMERTKLATFALSGSYVGTVATMLFGGIIAEALNWESIFYIIGGLSLIWAAMWFAFVYESPAEHKHILLEEKLFVEASSTHHSSTNIPWGRILRSPPVWAIIAAHFAENWGFYTMLTDLPTYLSTFLNFKLDKAGLLASLPYMAMAIILYTSGYISDYVIEKKKTRVTLVRKIFCCVGLALQCLFMLLITVSMNPAFIIFCVITAIGFGGMPWSSFGVGSLDIGAGYANVIMSVSNFFATIPGIVSPILTGHLIASNKRSDWNTVFFISSAIFLLGLIVFALFGSGDTQEWAVRQRSDYTDITTNDQASSSSVQQKSDNATTSDKTATATQHSN